MAKKASSAVSSKHSVAKKKRKGVHAKSKNSNSKNATNYVKKNVGQGK